MREPVGQREQLDFSERRRDTRHAILIRANVQVPGMRELTAHAVDVSPSGLGLLSPVAVELDQEVRVEVPFEIGGEVIKLQMTGRVRYCGKQADNCFRVGLQFVNLAPRTAEFIAAICR